jgi:hypothetical protein
MSAGAFGQVGHHHESRPDGERSTRREGRTGGPGIRSAKTWADVADFSQAKFAVGGVEELDRVVAVVA